MAVFLLFFFCIFIRSVVRSGASKWTERNWTYYMLNIWINDDLFLSRMHVYVYIYWGFDDTTLCIQTRASSYQKQLLQVMIGFLQFISNRYHKNALKWRPLQISSPLIFVYHFVLSHFRLTFLTIFCVIHKRIYVEMKMKSKFDQSMFDNVLFFVFCLHFIVGSAVKITNFQVPSWHIIENEENPQPLILDCEYDFQANEEGIVLKWLLNDTEIYQWIPGSKPSSRVSWFNISSHIIYRRSDLMRILCCFAKHFT